MVLLVKRHNKKIIVRLKASKMKKKEIVCKF